MWSVLIDESPGRLDVTLRGTVWAKALAWSVLVALGTWAVLVTWLIGSALAHVPGSAAGVAWGLAYVVVGWLTFAAALALATQLAVRETLRLDDAGLVRERWVWSRPRPALSWPVGQESAFMVGTWPGFLSSPRSRTTPLLLDEGIEIDFGVAPLGKRQAQVIVDRLNRFVHARRSIRDAG